MGHPQPEEQTIELTGHLQPHSVVKLRSSELKPNQSVWLDEFVRLKLAESEGSAPNGMSITLKTPLGPVSILIDIGSEKYDRTDDSWGCVLLDESPPAAQNGSQKFSIVEVLADGSGSSGRSFDLSSFVVRQSLEMSAQGSNLIEIGKKLLGHVHAHFAENPIPLDMEELSRVAAENGIDVERLTNVSSAFLITKVSNDRLESLCAGDTGCYVFRQGENRGPVFGTFEQNTAGYLGHFRTKAGLDEAVLSEEIYNLFNTSEVDFRGEEPKQKLTDEQIQQRNENYPLYFQALEEQKAGFLGHSKKGGLQAGVSVRPNDNIDGSEMLYQTFPVQKGDLILTSTDLIFDIFTPCEVNELIQFMYELSPEEKVTPEFARNFLRSATRVVVDFGGKDTYVPKEGGEPVEASLLEKQLAKKIEKMLQRRAAGPKSFEDYSDCDDNSGLSVKIIT